MLISIYFAMEVGFATKPRGFAEKSLVSSHERYCVLDVQLFGLFGMRGRGNYSMACNLRLRFQDLDIR